MIIKPKLLMLVGLPGSGKSTYVKNLLSAAETLNCTNPIHIVSLDNHIMKAALPDEKYHEAFQRLSESRELNSLERKMMADVHSFAYSQLEDSNGICIWDQTNLNRKSRMRKLTVFNPNIWRREAIIFDPGFDIVLERLAYREKTEGKKIGYDIIEKMWSTYEAPDDSEGFDEVRMIND